MEFILQWIDELDDWLRAAGARLARLGRRIRGMLNEEYSWQGDDDPYLAELARQSHGTPVSAPGAACLAGTRPPGHADPYLAEVTRLRRSR